MSRALAAGLLAALAIAPPSPAGPLFRDVTVASGIDFVHSNGAVGDKQYGEVTGSGACVLDFDGDGRLDVYLVSSVGPNRLFRNLGGLRFEDVTERAGVGDEGYGQGAVAADVDNDGDPDLLVTNLGPNRFWSNAGDGTFVDRTSEAGLGDGRWSSGVAFSDVDRDGWLDAYIVNYVTVADPDTNVCRAADGHRLDCPPRAYPRAYDAFFANRGDGTFEDATVDAGLGGTLGRGLGVVATDYDRDGWPDLYVANDLDPNFLFHNLGNGRFEEVGIFTGTSHSEDGMEESGMGIAAGDYDNDGWIDLFVSNYVDETNSLYHNEEGTWFLDVSATSGLGPTSLPYVGWGTAFLDFDLDGRLDLFVANGHTESDAELVDPTSTWKQPDFLWRQAEDGRFVDVTDEAAPDLRVPRSGRGATFADLDDDGDVEILVVNQNAPAVLLEAMAPPGRRWVGFRLEGTRSNRDGVGARLDLFAGDLRSVREIRAGSGYLSGYDPRILFGLGERTAVDSVVVAWPSGARTTLRDVAVDRYHHVVEER